MVFHFSQYHPANRHGVQPPVSGQIPSCIMRIDLLLHAMYHATKKLHTMRYHEDTMAKKLCLSAMLGMPCLLATVGTPHQQCWGHHAYWQYRGHCTYWHCWGHCTYWH